MKKKIRRVKPVSFLDNLTKDRRVDDKTIVINLSYFRMNEQGYYMNEKGKEPTYNECLAICEFLEKESKEGIFISVLSSEFYQNAFNNYVDKYLNEMGINVVDK